MKSSTLGTKGDLPGRSEPLRDWPRRELEVAASEHVNFLKNQMTWRVVERIDGRPWMSRPITLADSSSTVSPFVTVAT